MSKDYIPDCLFPTDNQLEIPMLRMDMQPKFAEIPFLCFGEQKRTHDMKGTGTLHFYSDDYRFNAIFEHPEKVLNHHPANIVEPNFSLHSETPIAFGMKAIYKKRFIARAMQEKHIGVFVDLNVDPKFAKLNILGVPIGYQSFCTRGDHDRLANLELDWNIANAVANGNTLLFVVYGGGRIVRDWCIEHHCIYVTPIIAIKNKIKALEKMKQNIAFFNTTKQITATELYKNQVENFQNNLLEIKE